jgi:hypothetical protein
MKKINHIYPIIGSILILLVVSCEKIIPDPQQDLLDYAHDFRSGSLRKDSANKKQDSINKLQDSLIKKQDSLAKKQDSIAKKDTSTIAQVPYPQTPPVIACLAVPIYGDTIVFPQPTNGSDYIIHPVNSPGAGKYFSWPVGLVLDSLSGAINVTKSETGLKFAIGFVKNGTRDTCLQDLVLGGVSYEDSVYVLSQGGTKAAPYYYANPYLPPVCNGQGQGSGCTFDVNGTAAGMKVIVDKNTGVIDLQKTLNGGLLGGAFGLLPLNGNSITTTIYYRLNDASNNALQHIDVQLVYYDSKSLISQGLLGNIFNKLDNLLSGHLISTSVNPRPPLVIIVRHN